MATILFWNLNKRTDILDHLRCLVKECSIDVFLLAECPGSLDQALARLNNLGEGFYREVQADAKVRAITRFGPRDFVHRHTSLVQEMAVWLLPGSGVEIPEFLLAGVHLPSKFGGNTDADQNVLANEVVVELCDIEDKRGHQNTVIVGDFNMDPFDPGMTSAAGLHGLMTRTLAEKEDRILRGRPRRRFYNPMWGFFGDRTPGPAGSYFWKSSAPHNRHWSMLDQVLVRPSLIARLREISILTHDGEHPLIDADGTPDKELFSDHLPVLFSLVRSAEAFMASQVQSLWPKAIRSNILSPHVVLLAQADALSIQTGGVLLGEVSRREIEHDRIALGLDIVVPSLNGVSYRIVLITHGRDMPYPAWIDSLVFREAESGASPLLKNLTRPSAVWEKLAQRSEPAEPPPPGVRVDSDEKLIERIAQALTSPHVVSLAQSLIARANDASSTEEESRDLLGPEETPMPEEPTDRG